MVAATLALVVYAIYGLYFKSSEAKELNRLLCLHRRIFAKLAVQAQLDFIS